MNDLFCGKAFEELSENEMMEFDGGAVWSTLATSVSSLGCMAASALVTLASVLVTYYVVG